MEPILLTEVYEGKFELVESNAKGGYTAKGEFARVDHPTGNKRIYPRKIYEGEIKRLESDLKGKKVYGELDHPQDGKTKLTRVSHLVTSLTIDGDRVIGEADILDTKNGKELKAIINAGAKIGISSRGFGSVKESKEGNLVVQEDFKLMTFDFVASPADETAYPKYNKEDEDSEEITINAEETTGVKDAPDVVEDREEKTNNEIIEDDDEMNEQELRAKLKNEVIDEIATQISDKQEEMRKEIMNDPEFSVAKKFFEDAKESMKEFILTEDTAEVLAGKDKEVTEAKSKYDKLLEEYEKLVSLSRDVTYELFFEQRVGGAEYEKLARTLIGEMSQYKTLDSLEVKIDAIVSELPELTREEYSESSSDNSGNENEKMELRIAELESKLSEKEEECNNLQKENDDLKVGLDESTDLAKKFGVRAYAETKLSDHPDKTRLRAIINSSNVSTTEAVDSLIESFDVNAKESNAGYKMVEQVQRHVKAQSDNAANDENTTLISEDSGEVFGVTFDRLKSLAGVETKNNNNKE